MSFDAQTTIEELDVSMNSMLLLNSSCQALIEAEIAPVSSTWYNTLDQELGQAENLVVGWRQSGTLYFQNDILNQIIACGHDFINAKDKINPLFEALKSDLTSENKAAVITELTALEVPINQMISKIAGYLLALKNFEVDMQQPHSAMQQTISQVQAQEADIAAEISSINTQITQLNTQIATDRTAIAKAKSARTTGIVETIFGVIFAPVTGGASLILAGIGAASIADAQSQISTMNSQITCYQKNIVNDQSTLNDDQKTIATLNALTMSTGLVLGDLSNLDAALDSLRVSWTALNLELSDEITKLNSAMTASEVVLVQSWFNSACNEWDIIESSARELCDLQLSTHRVQIG